MMENYSLSDIRAATGDDNGFGGGNGLWIVLLFFLAVPMIMPMMMQMWNGNGGLFSNGGATAAAQQEILYNQQFDRIGAKLDDIGHGLCDGFYAINSAIKDCCCQTQLGQKDLIAHGDNNTASIISAMNNGFQRILDNQNGIEMQHLRDGQMRDYIDKSLCGIVRYPMQMSYCAPCNPFCGNQNPCGYGCSNGF